MRRLFAFAACLSTLGFLSLLLALACTPSNDAATKQPATPTPRTVFVDATRVPTVTPSPTPILPTPTATRTPTPTPTPEPLSGREAYCRDHALPTPTPEPDTTPTPVPTSPPGIADDDVPEEWTAKMDEIEAWVRNFYGVDEAAVGDFARRFVDETDWKEWMADGVEDWASDEDSTAGLWEQIYRTLTFLSPDDEYTRFVADYQGDRFTAVYISDKREFVVQTTDWTFDLYAEFTYAHEYTHHVQNVKYDYPFFKECFKADWDAFNALRGLIEGDAVRTGIEYIDNVIGWDNWDNYFRRLDDEDDLPRSQPLLSRYFNERTDFTYDQGGSFAFSIAPVSDCPGCDVDRKPIDQAFEQPPYTTEQIYYEAKYFDGEGRDRLNLPDDVLGEEWELRSGTTIGRYDWIALLATLATAESDEIEPEHPGWRGDYGMLFADDDERALYLRIAVWENNRYIESLMTAFNDRTRLKRIRADDLPDREPFEDLYFWRGDTGSIAMGVEIEPADRFFTMFLAVGPDLDTVEDAVYAGRDNLITDSPSP